MMHKKTTSYVAKPVDKEGNASYTEEEHGTWRELITRQSHLIEERACKEYLHGLELLNLSKDKIPQCPQVSRVLQDMTGWSLEPVSALIPFDQFFYLLANRKFPAATFIRRREELQYLQEPDIFHEIFGHCPLLTNKAYADFAHTYGKLGLTANDEDRIMLARLYWFTVEFGLIQQGDTIRAYGGGILSSMNEAVYCVESDKALRRPFDVLEVLRTPYRIDIMQPIYFVIQDFSELYQLTEIDLLAKIHLAQELGDYSPMFPGETSGIVAC